MGLQENGICWAKCHNLQRESYLDGSFGAQPWTTPQLIRKDIKQAWEQYYRGYMDHLIKAMAELGVDLSGRALVDLIKSDYTFNDQSQCPIAQTCTRWNTSQELWEQSSPNINAYRNEFPHTVAKLPCKLANSASLPKKAMMHLKQWQEHRASMPNLWVGPGIY